MKKTPVFPQPELWGGIECTINRIGNHFKDQLIYSGHYDRPGDIEAFAQLGIRSIRYPVLWERHKSAANNDQHWDWTATQLEGLRRLHINPIAGLVHHGSGPSFTNLLDPDFASRLAAYAHEVASRFPWLRQFTPVNEPLTTARFSGLYGHWYPHHKKEGSFYKMLLNQLKGVVLSMESIRSVIPDAELIQTEDLGKTHSTSLLNYQAVFENERRWLTFDILTGKVLPGHPQFEQMIFAGIEEKDILFFQEHVCPLQVLGLNYYVTSERWLDERLELYPRNTHGSNGMHQYADTEVVRGNLPARAGLKTLAEAVWRRYQLPLAVTEAHLHCTREEQMRWFHEIWQEAVQLCNDGVPVKAVTAWSLLGASDWENLLTKTSGEFESGVFRMNSDQSLRPTALVKLIRGLPNGTGYHPVLEGKGWWHGPDDVGGENQKLLLIGKSFHTAFSRICNQRGLAHDFAVHEPATVPHNIWGIIDLRGLENQPNTRSNLVCGYGARNIQYLEFSASASADESLAIDLRGNLTEFHIHEILNLLLDEETGRWLFDRGGIVFKVSAAESRQMIPE